MVKCLQVLTNDLSSWIFIPRIILKNFSEEKIDRKISGCVERKKVLRIQSEFFGKFKRIQRS